MLILPPSSARAGSGRLQAITREGMQLNAEMNNLTAERFNVAGALVAKLFGRPGRDRSEFDRRARGVRDVGIRTAMYGQVLFVALGLVAAVGTAVVYLIGGNLAVSGAHGRNRRGVRRVRRSDLSTARTTDERESKC